MPEPGGNEYSGHLIPSASVRLNRERAALQKDSSLAEEGIFHRFDDDVLHRATAVIVGPHGTPYARGFYFFEFTFPNAYPMRPPKVKFVNPGFCTRSPSDGAVAYNPNLYTNGKVCLSILGTWPHGPPWSPSQSFRSTLLSIQSLLCVKPWQNEPGRERDDGRNCAQYSAILRYENVACAALQLAWPLPQPFERFRPTMEELFLRYYDEYIEALADFDAREGSAERCPQFFFITRYAPTNIRQALAVLRSRIRGEEPPAAPQAANGSAGGASDPRTGPAAASPTVAAPAEGLSAPLLDETVPARGSGGAGGRETPVELRTELVPQAGGGLCSHEAGDGSTAGDGAPPSAARRAAGRFLCCSRCPSFYGSAQAPASGAPAPVRS